MRSWKEWSFSHFCMHYAALTRASSKTSDHVEENIVQIFMDVSRDLGLIA